MEFPQYKCLIITNSSVSKHFSTAVPLAGSFSAPNSKGIYRGQPNTCARGAAAPTGNRQTAAGRAGPGAGAFGLFEAGGESGGDQAGPGDQDGRGDDRYRGRILG